MNFKIFRTYNTREIYSKKGIIYIYIYIIYNYPNTFASNCLVSPIKLKIRLRKTLAYGLALEKKSWVASISCQGIEIKNSSMCAESIVAERCTRFRILMHRRLHTSFHLFIDLSRHNIIHHEHPPKFIESGDLKLFPSPWKYSLFVPRDGRRGAVARGKTGLRESRVAPKRLPMVPRFLFVGLSNFDFSEFFGFLALSLSVSFSSNLNS